MKQLSELERIEKAKADWNRTKNSKQSSIAANKKFKKNHTAKKHKAQKSERKPIEVYSCKCGNNIDMYNKKEEVKCYKCNSFYERNTEGRWITKKEAQEEREPLEILSCDCGNNIDMYVKKDKVKCYKCNCYHRKNEEGDWEKDSESNVVTMGDILIKVKNEKVPLNKLVV